MMPKAFWTLLCCAFLHCLHCWNVTCQSLADDECWRIGKMALGNVEWWHVACQLLVDDDCWIWAKWTSWFHLSKTQKCLVVPWLNVHEQDCLSHPCDFTFICFCVGSFVCTIKWTVRKIEFSCFAPQTGDLGQNWTVTCFVDFHSGIVYQFCKFSMQKNFLPEAKRNDRKICNEMAFFHCSNKIIFGISLQLALDAIIHSKSAAHGGMTKLCAEPFDVLWSGDYSRDCFSPSAWSVLRGTRFGMATDTQDSKSNAFSWRGCPQLRQLNETFTWWCPSMDPRGSCPKFWVKIEIANNGKHKYTA